MWRAYAAVLVVGCGATADPTDGVTSGTRLQVRSWQLGETRVLARSFFGGRFYDLARDEGCSPQLWSDGSIYCTPHDPSLWPLEVVYLDAACTQAVALANSPCQATAILAGNVSFDGVVDQLFRVGAARAASPYFMRGGAGSCIGPYPIRAVLDLGAEVTRAELVPMQVGAPHGSGRIRQRYWETTDGARAPFAPFDETLGSSCTAVVESDRARVAMRPDQTTVVSPPDYFRDAGCTVPLYATHATTDLPTILEIPGEACALSTYVELGPEFTLRPLYFGYSTSACGASPGQVGDRYFAYGAAIEPLVLARSPRDSGQRIEPIYFTADDIAIRDNGFVFDTERHAECQVEPFVDGRSRCVTAWTSTVSLFSDPACQSPIDLAETRSSCGASVATPPLAVTTDDCGTGIANVFQVGDRRAQAYEQTATGCVPYTGAPGTITELYDLGAEVPATAFAEATSVTD